MAAIERRWSGLTALVRRLQRRPLVGTAVVLLVAVVCAGVVTLVRPDSVDRAGASPQPGGRSTAPETGPKTGPITGGPTTSATASSPSDPTGSSDDAPTPEPTSLDPTAFPTISPCIAPRRFTVLTFNIHGGRTPHGLDLEAIAAEVRRAHADVVLLQEVDRGLSRTEFLDEPEILGRALGMPVYFQARVRSNAILTRFPVTEWGSVRLPQWPGKSQRRLVHASVLVEGQHVQVFNTHLDHTSAGLRLAQARAVREALARHADEPVVLGGDLNAAPGGAVLETLGRDLSDAWAAAGEGPGYTVPAHNPRTRIDYVLHNSWLTPRSAQVIPSGGSDHAAVRIVFDLWGTPGCSD